MNVINKIKRHFQKDHYDGKTVGVCGKTLNLNSYNICTDLQLQQVLDTSESKENVQYIYLSGAQITSIPAAIGGFVNLRELHLSNNQIQFIPWSIILLKKLEILNLSNNKIQMFPNILCYLQSLKELNLENNNLTKLPTELLNLPKIEVLKFSGNLNLKSPPLAVCEGGKDAIFQSLEKRMTRKNLWDKWKPYYIKQDCPSRYLNTLMEICIECILTSSIDFLSSTNIPPVMKNYISDVEKMEAFGSLPRLQKCSNCSRYFTDSAGFENHTC